MNDELWQQVQREASEIHSHAAWLQITPRRDEAGGVRVHVTLVGSFEAEAEDLPGSIVREIHRRLLEFEAHLE
ncbi:MAG TPA: hypothetical protein VNH11_11145 [Pirellulales bacterium]|nr:hypothetical protein [Pirellulales bacterium]